jgi:hypothetical protein
MGVAHALAVLHALLQAPPLSGSSHDLSTTLALPFPHVQQRLQQALPGVVMVVVLGVVVPWTVACVVPLQSVFAFPGLFSFVFFVALLSLVSLAHVLLRYVMVPGSSASHASLLLGGGKATSAVYGWLQTTLCVAIELAARIHQEPQLLVLFTLSLVHVWLVKSVAYGFLTDAASLQVDAQFSSFAIVGGVVSFASFLLFERRMAQDPFVLDRRSIVETVLVKDLVRAVRRGVLAYVLARLALFITRSDDVSLFAFRYYRAVFHITCATIDSFVLLSAASIFRVLLFRPNYKAVADTVATGSVWETLAKPRPGSKAVHDVLLGGALAVSSQSGTPLADQYVVAIKKRMDKAMQQISSGKVPGIDATYEQVEALETQFAFANLLTATKFDRPARQSLFGSETKWTSVVRATTSAVDCFTLMLQLINTISDRKHAGQESEAAAVEKSVSTLVNLLVAKKAQHPLFILDAHPHLSNLRVSSNGFKSKIQYYFASRIQFALRRFITEEARRRVFVNVKVSSITGAAGCFSHGFTEVIVSCVCVGCA